MNKMLVILTAIYTIPAFAGTCDLAIERFACPGKEAEAMAPYKGVNPTFSVTFAADEAACTTKALQFSKIVRKKILKKISVTPKYKGVALSPVSTEESCDTKKKKI